jgi:hypothetical protein
MKKSALLIPGDDPVVFDDSVGQGFPHQDEQRMATVKRLYEEQCRLYDQDKDATPADRDWFHKAATGGTTSDRCSVWSLAIQEAPLYGLPHLQSLLEMAQSEKHHAALLALDFLSDVFAQVYFAFSPSVDKGVCHAKDAPEKNDRRDGKERKLLYLSRRPDYQDPRKLLRWYVEDRVKAAYFHFLQLIERFLKSTIEHDREVACRLLFKTAMANGHEQTVNVITLVSNKFGDPLRKLSSRIIYYLGELWRKYPTTRPVILQAVCSLLLTTVLDRVLFYGITFLTQLPLHALRDKSSIDAVWTCLTTLFSKHVVPAMLRFEREHRHCLKTMKRASDAERQREVDRLQQRWIPRMTRPLLTAINKALPSISSTSGNHQETIAKLQASLVQLATQPSLASSLPALQLLYHVGSSAGDLSVFARIFCEATLKKDMMPVNSSTGGLLLRLVDSVLESERAQGRLKLASRVAYRVLRWVLPQDSAIIAHALVVVGKALAMQPGLRVLITMPAFEDLVEEEGKEDEGTLYDMVFLALHPNALVRTLAETILKQNWDAVLKQANARPHICEEQVDFLECLGQWRIDPAHKNWAEFAFLEHLRPVMESNRPKRRDKKTKKEGKEKQDVPEEAETILEEREDSFDELLDSDDLIPDGKDDGQGFGEDSVFADQADYLDQIASDYDGEHEPATKKLKGHAKEETETDVEDESFVSISESEMMQGLIEEVDSLPQHSDDDHDDAFDDDDIDADDAFNDEDFRADCDDADDNDDFDGDDRKAIDVKNAIEGMEVEGEDGGEEEEAIFQQYEDISDDQDEMMFDDDGNIESSIPKGGGKNGQTMDSSRKPHQSRKKAAKESRLSKTRERVGRPKNNVAKPFVRTGNGTKVPSASLSSEIGKPRKKH